MANVISRKEFDLYARLGDDLVMPLLKELRTLLKGKENDRADKILGYLIEDRERVHRMYCEIVSHPYYTEESISLDQDPVNLAKEMSMRSQSVALVEVLGIKEEK